MRISDWSSDVCSSDLSDQASESTNEANDARGCSEVSRMATPTSGPPLVCAKAPSPLRAGCPAAPGQGAHHVMLNAFFANADRQSVGLGKGVSVRVDFGGRSIIKKKNNT